MLKNKKVVKDESYHESAVRYNEELQKFAEKLAEETEHPEIKRWCLAVMRQHKYHRGRHLKALSQLREKNTAVVETEDGGEDVVLDDERTVHRSAESGQFVTEETADSNPETNVQETVEASPPAAQAVDAAPDQSMAAEPVDAGVEPVGMTEEEAAEAFAKAQADAEASKNGVNNG